MAEKYIKQAAFGEYPFGQNNLGLLNEIYLNNIIDAEYFYQKSSKNHFALAYYNLGHLKEKEGKIEESIEFFKKCSKNEDSPMIFHHHQHYDKRLEISTKFIICFTNLKISIYFYEHSLFDKSKKYFIKAFSKLIINTEQSKNQFCLKISKENHSYLFKYIKNFIFNHPLFNLINQSYLSQNIINNFEPKIIKFQENIII